jgi:hypothetical protein
MKKIIIFIDSHNDLDQILPFIDYLLLNNKAKVLLYKTKKSILSNCKDHLSYLKNTYNLSPVYYDRNFSKKYEIFTNYYFDFMKFAWNAKQTSYLLPFLILISRVTPIISYLTEREVGKNKEDLDADIIMMDFGKENGFFGSAILKYTKNKNIPVVGYAHGFSIYTNIDPLQQDKATLTFLKRAILKLSKPKVKRRYFDRYVVGVDQKNTYFSTSMMSQYDSKYLNRVYEIGALRYTYEWTNKYMDKVINLKNFTYGDENKLNVVLFMSHPKYNVHMHNLIETIKKLSMCNDINFVYKPHTRHGLNGINCNKLNAYNATDISSIELSSWADVGIVYGSSISFQLVIDNVAFIMPRYLHSNTTIFDAGDVCIVVDDIVSLIDIMKHSVEEISNMTNQKKINNFIKYYVYGEKSYSDLMESFYDSVVNCNKLEYV